METPTKVIFFRESLWQSIIADVFSFCCLLTVLGINAYFFGNNIITSAVVWIAIIVFIFGREDLNGVYTDKQKLIEELQKEL